MVHTEDVDIVNLFAGADGWGVGLRMVAPDLADRMLGIELERWPCETMAAAGHRHIQADVRTLDPTDFAPLTGLIASAPCTAFSLAGKGAGRLLLAELAAMILDAFAGAGSASIEAHRRTIVDALTPVLVDRAKTDRDRQLAPQRAEAHGLSAALSAEPARWIAATRPEWIALEQVPLVMPLWEVYADALRGLGYSVWTGVLSAADYGVPQTRKRAFLIASRVRQVQPPTPTHSAEPTANLFATTRPWVTMSQALGWTGGPGAMTVDRRQNGAPLLDPDRHPSPTVTSAAFGKSVWSVYGDPGDGPHADPAEVTLSAPHHTRAFDRSKPRTMDQPAPTMTFGNASAEWQWRGLVTDPPWRRNDQAGPPADPTWPLDRPATTIAGRDLVPDPGTTRNQANMDAATRAGQAIPKTRNDGYRVTDVEAGVLQSFPPDYPWQGPKGARFLQIGNAVPPLHVAHVLAATIGLPPPA